MLYSLNYSSPIGLIEVTCDENALKQLKFVDSFRGESHQHADILRDAKIWLDRYFSGEDPGTPPPLAPEGTPFQQKVWNELMKLKRGELITYGELARRVNSHARAVGQAVGRNPLPLFIPCHRIVAAHNLGGYTPGIELKKKLLLLESGGDYSLDFTV